MVKENHKVRWLRHCATSQNVMGSIPDEVDFFNLPNPYNRTMALWLTQPLNRNEYQESFWGVKGSRSVRLITLLSSVSRLSRENARASTSHSPMGLHGLLWE
jgi:hypothetical protein